MVYATSGAKYSGTYLTPTSDEGDFAGWYTTADCTTKYSINDDGSPATTLTGDVTVYAKYQPAAKYAVAIYDIGVDEMADGSTGGLTFGPALGANYVANYKSHTPSGTTSAGNAKRCVHDDSWSTIIGWNKKDPYVYEDCIANGCTHSVALNKNTTTTILSSTFDSSGVTGDGPSALYYELITKNSSDADCYENLRWHPNGGTYGTNSGGWGTTRIRAMLNGADDLTDTETANYSSYASSDENKSASIYTSTNCLLATFPTELQNAIGARNVKYDSVYNEKTQANLKTSNDKLWLFSPNELGDSVSAGWANHPLEGSVYAKFKGSGNVNNSYDGRKPYRVNSNTGASVGSVYYSWLRSSRGNNNSYALYLRSSGVVSYNGAYYYSGASVGFTLAR